MNTNSRPAQQRTTTRAASQSALLTLFGAASASLMVAYSFLARAIFDMPTLAEIIATTILRFVPIGAFSFALSVFGGWAKPLLLGSVILGIVSLGASIARFDGEALDDLRPSRRLRRTLGMSAAVGVPLALFGVIASPLGVVFFPTNRELLALQLSFLTSVLIYAGSLYWLFGFAIVHQARSRDIADEPPESLGRRELIGKAGAGVVGLVSLAYLGDLVVDTRAGSTGDHSGDISQPITPVPEFYTVSKNFLDPTVGLTGWSLNVRGMVERPTAFSYDELRAMPAVEQHATLTCISNPTGGDLIDNAVWTGARLSELLERAGVEGEPRRVAFFGDDGYSDSFEFEKALEPTTIVAYLMNGEPLADKHGFPARLIVPGKYGIKNGKWLRRIELVRGDFRGYWQTRGWTNVGNVKTMSTFERPRDRDVLNGRVQEIGGVAFAGPRGISRVEYSTDGGDTWRDADNVLNPGPLSWTIWSAIWEAPSSGAYRLVVRATDGAGTVQSDEHADPLPDGASGYHRVVVGIA